MTEDLDNVPYEEVLERAERAASRLGTEMLVYLGAEKAVRVLLDEAWSVARVTGLGRVAMAELLDEAARVSGERR